MATNGLLFASDRDFVRDVCRDAAVYFDPTSPTDCAESIINVFSDTDRINDLVHRAHTRISRHPTARDRALEYIGEIDKALKAP